MLSHFNHAQFFETLLTVAPQAPLSMGFSRQEYWSGLLCPPPRDLPQPGIEQHLLHWQADLYHWAILEAPSFNNAFFKNIIVHPPCWEYCARHKIQWWKISIAPSLRELKLWQLLFHTFYQLFLYIPRLILAFLRIFSLDFLCPSYYHRAFILTCMQELPNPYSKLRLWLVSKGFKALDILASTFSLLSSYLYSLIFSIFLPPIKDLTQGFCFVLIFFVHRCLWSASNSIWHIIGTQ